MCSHISEYYAKHGSKAFQVVNSCFSASALKTTRKHRALSVVCAVCSTTTNLLSCLHCIYFGCRAHMEEHFVKKKHYIGLNLNHGHCFCYNCSDYVYFDKFLKINEKNQYKAAKSLKKSVSYTPWFPSEADIAILAQHPRKLLTENNRLGLRGLFNLGSTCFMNCIVQVLIHTPVLRDFFFSDRHNCKLSSCMVCEISKIFQEFYSGKTSPISLHDLLYLIWKNAR